jgi:hypothetical protein
LKKFARSVDFIHDDSDAPDVYLLVITLGFYDLWSHIVLAAAVGFGFVSFEVDDACHTKIYECCFDLTLMFDII